MLLGVPKEIKADEYRVALTPSGVRELVDHGHGVVVEVAAGAGSAIADGEYLAQGARLARLADEVFAEADLIVKVKEPQAVEVARLARAAPHAVHVPAPGGRPGTDTRADGVGGDVHRL